MDDFVQHRAQGRPIRGLFITFGAFSLANTQLKQALERVRCDISFDTLDISAALRRRPFQLARIIVGTLQEYGLGALRGKSIFRYRVLRSCTFYAAAQRLIAEAVARGHYDFTLQTQSLFDAAIPGVPNYIYTDHVATARVHQGGATGRAESGPSAAWLKFERQIYTNAAHVFVFGTSIRDRLVNDYGLAMSRVSAVGGGALPANDPDTSPGRFATRRILFVGVEWERKGGPELIQAFRRLRNRFPDATLTIVGCSPTVNEPGVKVMGRIQRQDLDPYYRDCACFCMPSRLEPFGFVYVEAMKHGRPVIACRVGDVADIVAHGKTGLLVPPGDVSALALALETLLASPDRARDMGLAGQARAARFDWSVIAAKISAHLPSSRQEDSAFSPPVQRVV